MTKRSDNNPFAPIVLVPGSPEWRVVHEALDQFTANHGEYVEEADDDGRNLLPAETIEGVKAKQETAEALLDKFTSVFCALADM